MGECSSENIAAGKRTSFAGDVGRLASGTVFAQVLMVLAAPFLTRLYTPEAFGILALFVSITSILTVVSCMRYELSIMLPERDEEAANLLAVSLVFVTLISMLTVFVVWWGRTLIVQFLNAPDLLPYLWLTPPAVFIGGVFLAFSYWHSRIKDFGRLSIAKVMQSLILVSGQLSAGYAGYATGGSLVGAHVTGQAVGATVLGRHIWQNNRKLLCSSIRWRDMRNGVKRHRKFPMYSTGAAVLNTVSWQLPVMLLSTFFSPVIVGFYALSYRVLKMPMNLVGTSIAKVFFQRAAEAKAKGELAPLVEKVFKKLVMMGLFPMLMLTVIGEDLFVLVFGTSWAEAGVYAQMLGLFIFFQLISSPISTLFSVLEKQGFGLGWNILNFVTRVASLSLGGILGDARIAVFMFSASGVLLYGYLCCAIMKKAGVSLGRISGVVLANLSYFLPAGAILVWLRRLEVSSSVILIVALLFTVFYFLYLLLTQNLIKGSFLNR